MGKRNEQDDPVRGGGGPGGGASGGAGGTPDDLYPELENPEDAADARLDDLRRQLDELNSKYLRTLADYQNSQRRAAANESEARQQGVTGVVRAVLTVVDHFDLALAQDMSRASAAQIAQGVRVIRDELAKVLQNQGVTPILPEPNTPFDPMQHEAVMQQPGPGVEPGHITAALQAGYMLGSRVIRPAKVSVAPGQG